MQSNLRAVVAGPVPSGSDGRPVQTDLAIVLDARGRVIEWSSKAVHLLGYGRAEAVGRDLAELIVPPGLLRAHRTMLASVLADRSSPLLADAHETTFLRLDGEEVRVLVRLTRTETEPPNLLISIGDLGGQDRDVANHLQLETIVDCCEDAMATLDPDGYVTTWNPAAADLYGFTAAEALGRKLSLLIVPPELMHEPQEWLDQVACGLRVKVETRRLRKDRSEVLVCVRMLPVWDGNGGTIGSVMIARDVTARHRLAEQDGHLAESRRWQRRIEAALRDDDFIFAAQPIIDLRDGRVRRHELLLRMRLDQRTAAPGEFIPYAERSGQIVEIDSWAVRRALVLARHHPVAVNVSAVSLGGDGLLATVSDGLDRTGIDPADLTLEITESAAVDDLEKMVAFTRALSALGCQVSLDDFGTGFGSFTYLNQLPATELKIDREFVARAGTDSSDRRIVRTIVDIARNFGMRTVAEGVEDEATMGLLLRMGVDYAQGYLLGMPLPIEPGWSRS